MPLWTPFSCLFYDDAMGLQLDNLYDSIFRNNEQVGGGGRVGELSLTPPIHSCRPL